MKYRSFAFIAAVLAAITLSGFAKAQDSKPSLWAGISISYSRQMVVVFTTSKEVSSEAATKSVMDPCGKLSQSVNATCTATLVSSPGWVALVHCTRPSPSQQDRELIYFPMGAGDSRDAAIKKAEQDFAPGECKLVTAIAANDQQFRRVEAVNSSSH